MRTSEWIQAGFVIALAVAAWFRPLPVRRRWVIALLAAVAVAAIGAARAAAYVLPPLSVSILRDWLTAALLLVPYWQTGQFFLGPDQTIQDRLAAFDRRLSPSLAAASGTGRTRIGLSLEIAYLFCYPLVPLGLLTLYAAGLRSQVNFFWFVVLISTYACYALTPFFPALPPRSVWSSQAPSTEANRGRLLNRWILNRGSIHAISFPSAHVASALAVSLVLLQLVPAAGFVFLIISIWIAIGAVAGRYHYTLDVLLGAATALIIYLISYRLF